MFLCILALHVYRAYFQEKAEHLLEQNEIKSIKKILIQQYTKSQQENSQKKHEKLSDRTISTKWKNHLGFQSNFNLQLILPTKVIYETSSGALGLGWVSR